MLIIVLGSLSLLLFLYKYFFSNKGIYIVGEQLYQTPNVLNQKLMVYYNTFSFSIDFCSKYRHPKNIILLHGFNDYHYNETLHQQLLDKHYNVYALTLRNYGINKKNNDLAFYVDDFKDYFIELDKVFSLIDTAHEEIEVMAHSTGAIIILIYLYYKKLKLRRLILNSPFLEWKNNHWILKSRLLYVIGFIFPMVCLRQKEVPKDLNQTHYETPSFFKEKHPNIWDVNPKKEIYGDIIEDVLPYIFHESPVYTKWACNVSYYHRVIHHSIRLDFPVVVLATREDTILDYNHMVHYSVRLSNNLKFYTLQNAYHNTHSYTLYG
jgi:alpha-beta hydrolase superfamily lysophospholipase